MSVLAGVGRLKAEIDAARRLREWAREHPSEGPISEVPAHLVPDCELLGVTIIRK